MNFIDHLRRGVALAAVAATVAVGMAGTSRAAINSAPPASAATDSALIAVAVPSAPRAVTATARSTAVTLTWRVPSLNGGVKIDKYVVQRATRARGPWKNIGTPATRGYTATGLANGTRYYFRIRAHNTAGWSAPSPAVDAVPRTVPSALRSPTAAPGNAKVKLAWLAPLRTGGATIDKYLVQRAPTAAGPWKNIATPATRGYTATGLTNGTRYYFRIRAHNAAGWGPSSTVTNAMPRSAPTVPQSPVATPGNGVVKLTWSAPSSNGGATVDKYDVQRAPSASGPWSPIAWPTGPSYTATGLTNGTRYYFRVRAHNALGWSAPTAAVDAAPRTVPSEPLSVTASPGKEMVALLWTAPVSTGGAPIDYYVVRVATSPAGPWVEIAKPTVLGYFASGLTGGTTYWFQVAAHNAAGTSAPGTIVSAVPMTVPSPPTKLEASLWYDEITLTWQPPSFDGASPVNQYQVEAATNLAGPWTTVATPVARLHVAKGAWPGLTYYFRVAAHNAMGWGPKTNITVAVPPKVPSPPTNCAANQLGGNGSETARITWNQPNSDGGTPVLFYEIEVHKYNGPLVMKTAVWSPGLSYDAILPTADPWQRYDIYISPFNKAGIGPPCTVPVWMYDKDF